MSTTQELSGLKERIAALVDEFESNIDWSNGRNNYGDNAAWEQAAQSLRTLLGNA